MSKYIYATIAALLTISSIARAEFTQPTDAQIQSAAQNPSEVGALLTDATDEQAVQVINAVVAAINGLELTNIQKKQRCGALFTAVDAAVGRTRAQVLLPQVVATMPPAIVPTTGTGAPFNIPRRPQTLPKYKLQG